MKHLVRRDDGSYRTSVRCDQSKYSQVTDESCTDEAIQPDKSEYSLKDGTAVTVFKCEKDGTIQEVFTKPCLGSLQLDLTEFESQGIAITPADKAKPYLNC